MSSDPHRISLGAYVLGALDPAERADLDSHLETCHECREELARLASLPGLLSRLTETQVLTDELQPSPALLDRVLAAVVQERRTARRRSLLTVATGALAAAAAAIAFFAWPSSSTAAVHVSASNPATHVRAHAALASNHWGTAITLSLSGVKPEERCELLAIARDGHREVAGTWQASYRGYAAVTGATAIPEKSIVALDVVTVDGQQLLHMPVNA